MAVVRHLILYNCITFYWSAIVTIALSCGVFELFRFTIIRDHPRSLCCCIQLPVKFHVNLIHISADNSHIWLEMPIHAPKIGVLGDFGPINVIIRQRDPQKAHPCVNPRLLSYQL